MGMPEGLKVIDAFLRPNPRREGASRRTEFYTVFTGVAVRQTTGATPDEIVAVMDEFGVEKALWSIDPRNPDGDGVKGFKKYPDRLLPYCTVDAHDGMQALRDLQAWVKEYPIRAVHMFPAPTKLPHLPLNDKRLYIIYAKCIELDLPVALNVGFPIPRIPGWVQHPMLLDEVCWFFPELKVVMCQGCEPWEFLCVKLMLKWPNLYYMTSGFSPKYFPKDIIYYANTRGQDKVMFATGYPLIDLAKAMAELPEVPLREHVWPRFVRENAIKVFKM